MEGAREMEEAAHAHPWEMGCPCYFDCYGGIRKDCVGARSSTLPH